MKFLLCFLYLTALLHQSYAPPVDQNQNNSKEDSEVKDNLEEYMEYHRYLKEVVQALESDQEFRERLEKADEEDVKSGKIAEQLDFVNHNVRTKLDEIKRRELERLRHLATKQYELANDIDTNMGKVSTHEHLDHANPHTFEIEDLKKLIKKTSADLEAADKQRRQEFKEYEMQKEFEKKQMVETLDEKQKQEYLENLRKNEEAKKHHKPLHKPGTKGQLEEVWQKADKMKREDFNPKVFFMMHDVDGNGVWDADEVKALFIKELDKLYGPGGPNKDLHERAEEMERMREHVFRENDKNRDGLIDFHEFLAETQRADFNQDEGWKSIDENQIYSQSEYEEFQKRKLEEMMYLQGRGLVDAHGRPLPGAQHQINQALHQYYMSRNNQHYQQMPQGQMYPGQGQQQMPQGQMYPGQVQQQMPQGQIYQGQMPAGQMHPGQISQGHAYQGQVPQSQMPQAVPQGQMPQGVPQNQIPQGVPQNQIPQGVPQNPIPQGVPQNQIPQGVPQNQIPQGVPQNQIPQGVPLNQIPQGVPQSQYPQGVPQGQNPQSGAAQGQGQNPHQGYQQIPQSYQQGQAPAQQQYQQVPPVDNQVQGSPQSQQDHNQQHGSQGSAQPQNPARSNQV